MNVKLSLVCATGLAAVAALATALMAVPAHAAGNAYGRQGVVYDYARVLSAQPNIRYVTVTTPVRECWEETRYYPVENRPAGRFAGTLMGAVIGGVVGHQFGSGRGNDAATVAGTLIGAAIGDSSSRARGVEETTEYARPVRRCETQYQSHEEERIYGYRVIYEYHGQKYATDTPYDPGDRIRIRVDVRPAP
jgi:uncharacterized protein YcfJ